MAVGGSHPSLGAVLDQKVNVDNLGQDEDCAGEIVNKISELIYLLTASARDIRHPPEAGGPLRRVSGRSNHD